MKKHIITVVAVCWCVFGLLIGGRFFYLHPFQLRVIHLTFALVITFLSTSFFQYGCSGEASIIKWPFNLFRKIGSICDIVLVILSVVCCIYLLLISQRVIYRLARIDPLTSADIVFGIVTILLVLEATRRKASVWLSALCVVFLSYAFLGKFIPGRFGHPGFTVQSLLDYIFLGTDGLFGIPLGTFASFVFMFIIFGAILEESGVGNFFTNLAISITGRSIGGPAKAAVVASALMGTICGSGSANVAATGVFTIPLMKKTGYPAEFAGGVEAVASTGGAILPPIMGAAAFIMAELTGIPYWDIAKAAAIPAILYYISVFLSVHFMSLRLGLRAIDSSQIPRFSAVIRKNWHLFIPIIILVYMLGNRYSLMRAIFITIPITIAITWVRPHTRLGLMGIINAFERAGRIATSLVAAVSTAGLILGVIFATGVALELTRIAISASQGQLPIFLILVALISVCLGMGMGPTAVYITVISIVVRPLLLFDISLLGANLFAFYYGVFALITPPVATAAYVAAGIAETNPLKTGFQASKLGIVGLIIPFFFIYSPALLFIGTPWEIVSSFITATIGVIVMASAMMGYFVRKINIWTRVLFFLGGLLLISTSTITNLIGGIILILIILSQFVSLKRKSTE